MTIFNGAVQRLGLIALTVLGMSAGKSFADELNIYNWGEYINPAVLQKFEEETKVKVNLSTYSSNEEMLAKIQGGASGYDIVFPSVHMQDIMAKLDLLAKTDINTYEGFKNIDPRAFCAPKVIPTENIARLTPSARWAFSITGACSARM